MRVQVLSDLHFETESFDPEPAPGAEMLVLAGDIDSNWSALDRFAGWPQPVVFVAGNHEFDGRDLTVAGPALRRHCAERSITLLERDTLVVTDAHGARIRLVGTTRWPDFDVFGAAGRVKAMRAAAYFLDLMQASRGGWPFDAEAMREEGLAARAWLHAELARPPAGWDRTVVITHFAPSLRSADPRYGTQAGTASFCNGDDDLFPGVGLWIHGHLHCAHDYRVEHPDAPPGGVGATRVVCNPRGYERKGETAGHRPLLVVDA